MKTRKTLCQTKAPWFWEQHDLGCLISSLTLCYPGNIKWDCLLNMIKSGQIIIFHQPGFSWNFRGPISLPKRYLLGAQGPVWGRNNLTRLNVVIYTNQKGQVPTNLRCPLLNIASFFKENQQLSNGKKQVTWTSKSKKTIKTQVPPLHYLLCWYDVPFCLGWY